MDEEQPQIERARGELAARISGSHGWDESCDRAAQAFATAMARGGLEQGEMLRRLREAGLSRRGSRRLVKDAMRTLRADRAAKWNAQFEGALPVCPHCLREIATHDHFCPHCAGPVTAIASIDPMGQVYSAGRAYQQAASGGTRTIVLVGMWLIFGPSAVLLAWCVYLVLAAMGLLQADMRVQSDGLGYDIMKLLVICFLLAINCAILWKVSARYIRARRTGR